MRLYSQKTLKMVIAIFVIHTVFVTREAVPEDRQKEFVEAVSFVRILVRPEDYEGRLVSVIGYFSRYTKILYENKEGEKFDKGMSAIGIHDPTQKAEIFNSDCTGNYVRIIGRLKRSPPNSIFFALSDIQEIYKITPRPNYNSERCWAANNGAIKDSTSEDRVGPGEPDAGL